MPAGIAWPYTGTGGCSPPPASSAFPSRRLDPCSNRRSGGYGWNRRGLRAGAAAGDTRRGRKLGAHVRKTIRLKQETLKRSYIEKYLPAIAEALRDILNLKDPQLTKVQDNLKHILSHSRKM